MKASAEELMPQLDASREDLCQISLGAPQCFMGHVLPGFLGRWRDR
jgi:hypothetical protein